MGKKKKLVSENGRGTSPWSELNEKSNISKPKEGKMNTLSPISQSFLSNTKHHRRKKKKGNIVIYCFPF